MSSILEYSADEWKELLDQAWCAEETRTPCEVACEHLRHAIEHFCKREYVPAITLAGAAQEVLGRIAKNRTGQDAIDRSLDWHTEVAKLVGYSYEPELTRKHVADGLNWIRNQLKHNSKGLDEPANISFGKAAVSQIDAAVLNLILIEGHRVPRDPVIAAYHAMSPTWEGGIPT